MNSIKKHLAGALLFAVLLIPPIGMIPFAASAHTDHTQDFRDVSSRIDAIEEQIGRKHHFEGGDDTIDITHLRKELNGLYESVQRNTNDITLVFELARDANTAMESLTEEVKHLIHQIEGLRERMQIAGIDSPAQSAGVAASASAASVSGSGITYNPVMMAGGVAMQTSPDVGQEGKVWYAGTVGKRLKFISQPGISSEDVVVTNANFSSSAFVMVTTDDPSITTANVEWRTNGGSTSLYIDVKPFYVKPVKPKPPAPHLLTHHVSASLTGMGLYVAHLGTSTEAEIHAPTSDFSDEYPGWRKSSDLVLTCEATTSDGNPNACSFLIAECDYDLGFRTARVRIVEAMDQVKALGGTYGWLQIFKASGGGWHGVDWNPAARNGSDDEPVGTGGLAPLSNCSVYSDGAFRAAVVTKILDRASPAGASLPDLSTLTYGAFWD